MARVMDLVEMIEGATELRAKEVETHLTLVGREAAFVERLAGELKAGILSSAELPALLANLAARLFKLADPARSWRGIGRWRSEIR